MNTVEQYLASLNDDARAAVEQIRSIAAREIGGEESISYGIIGIKRAGKPVMYIGGFPKHVSIYPVPPGDKNFEELIKPYRAGKGTLKFLLQDKLPLKVIRAIVRAHADK